MATINGTSLNDLIHFPGDGHTGANEQFSTNGADSIIAGAGNDSVYAANGADTILGGLGFDLLYGEAGADNIDGGEDNDTIVGGQGADNLQGGIGADLFQVQNISDISGLAEVINGGSEIDTLDFQAFNAFGAVDLTLATFTGVERLSLSTNDVTLTAAQLGAFETISGAGATDRLIFSGAGTADLTGAVITGIDEIRGSSGADQLILTGVTTNGLLFTGGAAGADTLIGGLGDDIFDAGTDNDSASGSDGNDQLSGGAGTDALSGDNGNDTLTGGSAVDNLSGGIGNDFFRVQFVSDISGLAETINGGVDTDTIDFQTLNANGAVNLTAAIMTSIERLFLSGNTATLTSAQLGAFTDIVGSGLVDRINIQGAGTVDLTGANIVNIEEFHGSSGNNNIVLTGVTNFQTVFGEAGNDTIRGGLGGDLLIGGVGNDLLVGNESSDSFQGGVGADNLQGGIGNDFFDIVGVSDIDGLAEKVNGGADIDTLSFQLFAAIGPANLTLATFTSVEVLRMGGNDLTMSAVQMSGFDTIAGNGNIDRLILSAAGTVDLTNAAISNVDEIRGTAGGDTFILTGGATGQLLKVLADADSVTGSDGNDTVDGGGDNDTLLGGDGADRIIGGIGKDSMTGGAAVDAFDFNDLNELGTNAATRDVVVDFVHGQDVVDLQDIDANTEIGGNQNFTFVATFGGNAGELRFAAGVLSGDVNGDSAADFQIAFSGGVTVTAGDIFG